MKLVARNNITVEAIELLLNKTYYWYPISQKVSFEINDYMYVNLDRSRDDPTYLIHINDWLRLLDYDRLVKLYCYLKSIEQRYGVENK